MTEAEWLASEDPKAMLDSLRREWDKGGTYYVVSDRKLRLIACAFRRLHPSFDWVPGDGWYEMEADGEAFDDYPAVEDATNWLEDPGDRTAQAAVIRDIVGNPFRPVRLPNAPGCAACGGAGRFLVGTGGDAEAVRCRCCPWLTPQVLSLAQAAYSGDWSATLPLSDALEEVGCDSACLLHHLRSPIPHVRGCWAIDLLLGKE